MKQRPTTIGVIVPAEYSGGTMRAALNAAIQIHDGARTLGDSVSVEFGYVDVGQAKVHVGFKELEQRRIPYRPITLRYCDPAQFDVFSNAPHPGVDYLVFDDAVSNFDHVDFLLIISGRMVDAVPAPTYRYGMVVHDFIERYVPEIIDGINHPSPVYKWRSSHSMLRSYERAEVVFVSTEQARSDAISFAGVPSPKVIKLPMEFDPIAEPRTTQSRAQDEARYIIWTTNISPHKNHDRALAALEEVYRADSDFPNVLVTGQWTYLLDLSYDENDRMLKIPYVKALRARIARSKVLKNRLIIAGNLPDEDFVEALGRAELLFHPALFDNGTYAVVEAAWRGVPSVSSRYAAMEEIEHNFGLPLCYFDPSDVGDIARGLREGFRNRELLKARLPTRAELAAHSRDSQALDYWKQVRAFVIAGRAA